VLTAEDIRTAAHRLAPVARRTPVVDLQPTALGSSRSVSLKLESMQISGSFKIRGATNKLLSLGPAELARGVATASGGNHGIGVAHAAAALGVPATVFVPAGTPAFKQAAIRSRGAEVVVVGATWDEADRRAREVAAQCGAVYVHPFADPLVMAGQGTLGLEILEQVAPLDILLVAIGGGGLIGGVSVAVHDVRPDVRIIGVEPEGAPKMLASVRLGHVAELPELATRAGSLAPRRTTEANLALVQRHVEQIVLVSDAEMQSAVEWLDSELAISVELGGAAAIAALRGNKIDVTGAAVCALVCGRGPHYQDRAATEPR
jgi:threonine dehydratase